MLDTSKEMVLQRLRVRKRPAVISWKLKLLTSDRRRLNSARSTKKSEIRTYSGVNSTGRAHML